MTSWSMHLRTARPGFWVAGVMAVILCGCATSSQGHLSKAARDAVHSVEETLNRPQTLHGIFLQEGPDAQRGWGRYTYRPGYLHLAYATPHGLNAEAQRGHLVVTDQRSGAETRIGLAHNPLGLLLRQPLRLDREIEVTQVQLAPNYLRVSLAAAANPSQGLLTLDFARVDSALTLIDLIGTDARRQRIKLVLHPD